MKSKKLLLVLLAFSAVLFSFYTLPASAQEDEVLFVAEPIEEVIYDQYYNQFNESYATDKFGNLNNNLQNDIASVEVVYDGAWDNIRGANVPRTINVSVICRGTGIFSDPMYNCTLNVAVTYRYDSDTRLITGIDAVSVYSYSAPGTPQAVSNPRATCSITNGGRSVTIYGYINYSAAGITQTFSGATTFYN